MKKDIKEISVNNLLSRLVLLQSKYIKMLSKELDETCLLAHIHGWRSKRVDQGEKFREQIKHIKKAIISYESVE